LRRALRTPASSGSASKTIDLFYQQPRRPESFRLRRPSVPWPDWFRPARLRRALGPISEAGPQHNCGGPPRVHPNCSACRSEYSLWSRRRGKTNWRPWPTCRELGKSRFFPYSPPGTRVFDRPQSKKLEDLDASDWRRTNPRFPARKSIAGQP